MSVIIYSDANFRGHSATLGTGRYDMHQLGIGNDQLSSLRVSAGFKATLYQHARFKGNAVSYTVDTPWVGAMNDQTSSIIVESDDPEVTIYEDAHYRGRNMTLDVGRYDMSQLAIGNDQLSSVRVPPGYRVTLFQHAGFSGKSVELTEDVDFVRNFNDQTSSIVVQRVGASSTGTAPVRPSPAGPPQVAGNSGASSVGKPSGSASSVVELPDQLKKLGTLDVSVLFVNYPLPLRFDGTIQVQPLSKAVSYSGKAALTKPFDVTVDPLEVSLFAADGDDGGDKAGWMVKFGLPSSRTIAQIVEDDVIDKIPGEVQPLIRALVMPYLSLYRDGIIILANEDGDDEELGSYLAGFNAFSTLKVSDIPPFDVLASTFPKLGLDQRDVVLGVGAATGAGGDFFVGMQLDLDVELGTKLVVFNSIALNVSRASTDTSVGAEVEFTLHLANDDLKMRGGITATTGTGSKATVWGALDAADGAWKNPFGIRGLTIGGMGVEVGATPTFPWIVLGVRGEAHIGNGLLGGRIGILVDASDWSKCILDIYSEEGIRVPALVKALVGNWLDLSKVIDVSITDLQIYVAPKGGTIAGKSYDAGLALGGKLDLWGFHAEIDGKLDYDDGGYLKGAMDPVRLSAAGASFLEITDTSGHRGASVDVQLGKSAVGGTIDGSLNLLGGLYRSQVQATMKSGGFDATLSGGSFGIYQNASLSMRRSTFRLAFGPSIHVSVRILGRSVGLVVGTKIRTTVTSAAFTQGISFRFSAMGVSYRPGPFNIPIPFRSIESLAEAFASHAEHLIVNGLVGGIKQAGEVAFDWVKSNVTQSAKEATKFFKDAGADPERIAKGTVKFMGATASDAVKYLELGANESAKLLKDGFHWTADQTEEWLKDVGGFGDKAVRGALKAGGFVVDGLSSAGSAVGSAVSGAAKDAGKAIGGAAKDTGKAIGGAAKSVGKAFKKY